MSSTNIAVVDGRLGRDSELRFSPSGFAFLSFSVAVSSQRKNGEKWDEHTDWIDCKVIGKRAESLAKILVKGAFCVVSGHLEQETWEDKSGGGKRSKIVLFAENVSLGPKPAGVGGSRDSGGGGGYEPPPDDDGDSLPF